VEVLIVLQLGLSVHDDVVANVDATYEALYLLGYYPLEVFRGGVHSHAEPSVTVQALMRAECCEVAAFRCELYLPVSLLKIHLREPHCSRQFSGDIIERWRYMPMPCSPDGRLSLA